MTGQRRQPPVSAFGALQRFARRPVVGAERDHVMEGFVCACQAYATQFSGQMGQRYKRAPSLLPAFRLPGAKWEGLLKPLKMAFLFQQSPTGKMVAVATKSQLPLDKIDVRNPVLQSMEPDVEARLVNRLVEQRGFPSRQYSLLPLDQCFKLAGLVRTHWHGLFRRKPTVAGFGALLRGLGGTCRLI